MENIPVPYSEGLLAATRQWLSGLPDERLITNLTEYQSPVYQYYRSKKNDEYHAYKFALAHALVKRGFVVRSGCVVDDLTVEKE